MRKIISLLLTIMLLGCSTVETRTEIVYVHPEIPSAIISPCDQIPTATFTTNGELLFAYLSLQSMYIICAGKVTAISDILESYETLYKSEHE